MSVAIDSIERMFDHGEMLHSADLIDPTWVDDVPERDVTASDSTTDHLDAARDLPDPGAAHQQPAPQQPAPRLSVRELQSRIRQMQGTKLDTRSLPTHPAIASLLPGGGLQQGAAYSVDRSATLLMALLAGPSAAGSWCGVVGVPEFGVEAAAGHGIDLDRLVLVPHPGDQWLTVTSAIADVLTVVVVKPPRTASDGAVARLAARLRQRGATLIVMGPWPQTDAMLSISHSRWSGIGSGHGRLAAREVTITVSTRAGVRPESTTTWLPAAPTSMPTSMPIAARSPLSAPRSAPPLFEPARRHGSPLHPERLAG